ncbi:MULTISPECIES: AtaL-like protein [Streptomyces]|uniref:AtaL-like protein n=1 Tax=Streptomyces TaxID=1883 RepID=UPI0004AA1D1B|nr:MULTISPECIES: AtaL-like protein [Streptomyces]
MRVVSQTVRVNDPADQDEVKLTRDDVWAGLQRKAENAVPFVAAMDECTVLERTENGLVREVVFHGERVREEIVFHPKARVSFFREDEAATWVIHNDIDEDENGLTLTFRGELDLGGGEAEDAAADRMHAGYLLALQTTLKLSREAVRNA